VEEAVCAAWHSVAAYLIHTLGFITFSVGSRRLLETAPLQLPWFDSDRFNLDTVDYSIGGRVPCSTPLERPLTFNQPDAASRPRGTLVAGSMRPDAVDGQGQGMSASGWFPGKLDSTQGSFDSSPRSPTVPTPQGTTRSSFMPGASAGGGSRSRQSTAPKQQRWTVSAPLGNSRGSSAHPQPHALGNAAAGIPHPTRSAAFQRAINSQAASAEAQSLRRSANGAPRPDWFGVRLTDAVEALQAAEAMNEKLFNRN
jgi:hypothetical protein